MPDTQPVLGIVAQGQRLRMGACANDQGDDQLPSGGNRCMIPQVPSLLTRMRLTV